MSVQTARTLRKRSTEAEALFWNVVRDRRFEGYKFLRQHTIPFKLDGQRRLFVADFYCFELRLVVEIDGGVHEQQAEYDELRTYIINTLGMRVVRFRNEDILQRLKETLGKLKRVIEPGAGSI